MVQNGRVDWEHRGRQALRCAAWWALVRLAALQRRLVRLGPPTGWQRRLAARVLPVLVGWLLARMG